MICLEDEEAKFRIEFGDKAVKGITDEKQAKAAAELFKGEFKKLKNKFGKEVNGYVIDECDREKYIERSVLVNMTQLRKTWAEKAMTGAKLRVIRALLGLKGTYTHEELKKNFAIPTVVFSPDYSDPNVRQAMLTQGMQSVNNMFGTPEIPVRRVDFEADNTFDVSEYADNPAFQSDIPEDDFSGEYQEPVHDGVAPDEPAGSEPKQEGNGLFCNDCGAEINERVYEYSLNKFGRPLCIKCQRGGNK